MPGGPDRGAGAPSGAGRPDVSSPAAGWYPVPDGAGTAWWTGRAWSDGSQDRPAPSADSSTRPALAVSAEPSHLSDDDVTGAVNRPARAAFLLGIAALVVNPFLLTGIAGVVAACIGLQRASLMGQHGFAPVGRLQAVVGLCLAVLGTVVSVAFKNSMF
ncbi:DUF2510 domain-containing protein [Pengzhenrongella sicca]|uniref:DUF2510 domain-containing protein n=1 Tax=Pengzhenrongella sicca TaxID=2819238 RepID=A0A8A4ZFG5_9MICO|nr:DUF2510 domain-containing protein [Pengzhenrongella sicca]QTE29749.1 hypothetical protein J4E96_01495 [Pengzhenrongella sicca]